MAKSLKISMIAIFVVVDLVAATFTIRHVNKRPAAQDTALAVATTSPSGTTSPALSPGPEPDGLIVGGGVVARYVTGSCDSPGTASLATSTDDAVTFSNIALPLEAKPGADGRRDAAVSSILAVTLETADDVSIVGTDASCTAHRYTTKNGGADWTQAEPIDDWYVQGKAVVTPGGSTSADCEASSVWSISDRNARVVCVDGQIRGTDDAGATWVGMGSLNGLKAASFSTIRDGFALADDADCDSRAYFTHSAGGNWAPVGCIQADAVGTAISGDADLLAALVGGDVYLSTDQGVTWKKP